MKKIIIFLLILSIVLLSGCLDVISTRQKQLCKSATHESNTSIFECTKTSECFKKVNSAGLNVSDKLDLNLKNQFLIYKNNISSAIFYFNSAHKNIQKINDFCSGEKDVEIIKNMNELFFNISKIFEYQDKSWQKSIEILKDYAIFLKENGVEEIPEEKIYDSYVIINQNINELRSEENLTSNYVSLLKIESKNANELAKKFGFNQSYMTEYGYVDLYAYYSEYIENPKKEIKLPLISKSSNYVFARLSTIENFIKINTNLSGADNYNLYILFDKEFGAQDSLFTMFIELNNEISENLDQIFITINDYEKNILENIDYLDEEHRLEFQRLNYMYSHDNIGFGNYLAQLKIIESIILENKNIEEETNLEIANKISACDEIAKEAKSYNNNYFKKLLTDYYAEENLLRKEEHCNKLKNSLDQKDCFFIYTSAVEIGLIENVSDLNDFECKDIINQLNYELEDDDRILLFRKIILESKNLLAELKKLELDLFEELAMIELNEKTNDYYNKSNIELILDIDKTLADALESNKKIKELLETTVIKDITKNAILEYNSNEIFLKINNKTNKTLDICVKLNIDDIVSLTDDLQFSGGLACIEKLYSGINYFKVKYENQRTIKTILLELDLEWGLYETTIENKVLNLPDTLFLGQILILDPVKYELDENLCVHYLTESKNKILYTKKTLSKTQINITTNKNSNDYLLTDIFRLKNMTSEKICNKIILIKDCFDCITLLKENGLIKPTRIENGHLKNETCFEPYEEKLFELNKIISTGSIIEDIDDTRWKLNSLLNCEFEEIRQEGKQKQQILEKINVDDLTVDAITDFYKLKIEIDKLHQDYLLLVSKLENVNLILSKLILLNLNSEEKKIFEEIENKKFTDIEQAFKNATNLYSDVLNRIDSEEGIYNSDFKNKINKLIEDGRIAGVIDESEINKLNSLSFRESEINEFKVLEERINNKIQEKAKNVNEIIGNLKGLDIKEINKTIEEIEYLYSNIDLKELYNVKYYPPVTLLDTERLKKKKDYLQTISFMQSASKFETNYNEEDYLASIKNLDASALERLIDINKEYQLLKSGLTQIKKDANTEIVSLTKYNKTKDTGIKQTILDIRSEFDKGNYLYSIYLIRILNQPVIMPKKTNYQVFVLLGLVSVISVGFLKFNKKKKKLNSEEKKQRILRQY